MLRQNEQTGTIMILLAIKFPNRTVQGYFDLEDPGNKPYIVLSTRSVGEKILEFRIHLDLQKILPPTSLLEHQTYQGSLSSSDIVVQETECH